jgi:rhodanese-related sulfurtransferase
LSVNNSNKRNHFGLFYLTYEALLKSIVVPFTYKGQDVANQNITSAASSGSANLPQGTIFLNSAFLSSELSFCILVSTGLGAIQFTIIPSEPSSFNSRCTTKGVIQPLKLKAGITTVAKLEVLDFIANLSSKNPSKYILVNSRTSDWFDAGTIPSSVNIPHDELYFDEDFIEEYQKAFKNLGIKILGKNKYNFKNAKTAIFFCNGAWCPQSAKAIK